MMKKQVLVLSMFLMSLITFGQEINKDMKKDEEIRKKLTFKNLCKYLLLKIKIF